MTQIRNPKAHDPNSVMPAFRSLGDQQINSLIDYLMSLGTESAQSRSTKQKDAGTMPSSKVQGQFSGSTGDQEHQHSASEEGKQPGQAAYIIGNVQHGKDIFEQKCAACHGPEGTDKVPNPGSEDRFVPPLNPIDRELFSKDPKIFAENIDRYIQHGSIPSGPNPQFHMLAFGDDHTLTQQQIANVEAYILHLNGVNRAQLINPGMQPARFFAITVPAVIVILLLLGGIYKCLPQGK
jgi:mono/diheme cytochrome c family protein